MGVLSVSSPSSHHVLVALTADWDTVVISIAVAKLPLQVAIPDFSSLSPAAASSGAVTCQGPDVEEHTSSKEGTCSPSSTFFLSWPSVFHF